MPSDRPQLVAVPQFPASPDVPPPPCEPSRSVPPSTVIIVILSCALLLSLCLLYALIVKAAGSRCEPGGQIVCAPTAPQPAYTPPPSDDGPRVNVHLRRLPPAGNTN